MNFWRSRTLRWVMTLLTALALLGSPVHKAAGAVVVGTNTTPAPTTTASWTFSHTVGAGSDRVLVVATSHRDGNKNVTNITFNGVTLTQAIQQNGTSSNNQVNIWYLVNPTVTTANVVITVSGSVKIAATAINLTGVYQAAPVSSTAGNSGTSTAPSATVVSASNELVMAAVAANGDALSVASGGGQISLANNGTGTGGGDVRMGVDSETGAASVTTTWTLGASKSWGTASASVRPSGAIALSGKVFEDVNYGGGAGRDLATAMANGGAVRPAAYVELYTVSGSTAT